MRKLFQIGGIIAGAVLTIFGVAAIYMGVDGRSTVRDSIKQEQITFGAADDPAVAKYASEWAEEPVLTGTQARAFAQVIHEHALEGSGSLGGLSGRVARLTGIRPHQKREEAENAYEDAEQQRRNLGEQSRLGLNRWGAVVPGCGI